VLEILNYKERSRPSSDGFANLVDECRGGVTHESRSLANMNNLARFEPHEACAGCIGSHTTCPLGILAARARSEYPPPNPISKTRSSGFSPSNSTLVRIEAMLVAFKNGATNREPNSC